jgi:hypothetical protein
VHGLGVVLAAKILGHVGDITRFPSQDHFASYTATAPLDASSGNQQRHRLNTGGNRHLNASLHTIAVCKPATPDPAAATTSASSAKERPQPKPAERSNDASPMSSTGASSPTNANTNQPQLMTHRGAVERTSLTAL